MSNIAYSIKESPIHYHGKMQGRCACGFAGLGASITADEEKVTCRMCKRVIEKKGEQPRRKDEKKK